MTGTEFNLKKSFEKLPQLRIAVNSRCERSCFYCRPSGEGTSTPGAVSLDPNFVIEVTKRFVHYGGTSVKLTGGDPALWKHLVSTVAELKAIDGLKHVEVISRHPKIADIALNLIDAGADVINMSVDSLIPERHKQITGVNDLNEVLAALEVCAAACSNCKVNTVVMKGVNDDELDHIIDYAARIGVKTVKFLDLIRDLEDGVQSNAKRLVNIQGRKPKDLYQPMDELSSRLEKQAVASQILHQGGLGHPMRRFILRSGLEVIIKDHNQGAWYGSICSGCRHFPCHDALMALRLTPDRRLQYCLLREDICLDVSEANVTTPEKLDVSLQQALSVYDSAWLLNSASEEV